MSRPASCASLHSSVQGYRKFHATSPNSWGAYQLQAGNRLRQSSTIISFLAEYRAVCHASPVNICLVVRPTFLQPCVVFVLMANFVEMQSIEDAVVEYVDISVSNFVLLTTQIASSSLGIRQNRTTEIGKNLLAIQIGSRRLSQNCSQERDPYTTSITIKAL